MNIKNALLITLIGINFSLEGSEQKESGGAGASASSSSCAKRKPKLPIRLVLQPGEHADVNLQTGEYRISNSPGSPPSPNHASADQQPNVDQSYIMVNPHATPPPENPSAGKMAKVFHPRNAHTSELSASSSQQTATSSCPPAARQLSPLSAQQVAMHVAAAQSLQLSAEQVTMHAASAQSTQPMGMRPPSPEFIVARHHSPRSSASGSHSPSGGRLLAEEQGDGRRYNDASPRLDWSPTSPKKPSNSPGRDTARSPSASGYYHSCPSDASASPSHPVPIAYTNPLRPDTSDSPSTNSDSDSNSNSNGASSRLPRLRAAQPTYFGYSGTQICFGTAVGVTALYLLIKSGPKTN